MGIEQILVKAGLVTEEQLNHDLRAAEYFGISAGYMVAGSKHVSDFALLTCMKLNSLMLDKVITLTQAAQIARFIVKHNKTWNDALLTVTGTLARPESTKLGELLVEAGLLTQIQAAAAIITATRNNVPLGQALVETNLLPKNVVVRALELQFCIRQKGMPFKMAAGQLRFNSFGPSGPTAVQQGIVRNIQAA